MSNSDNNFTRRQFVEFAALGGIGGFTALNNPLGMMSSFIPQPDDDILPGMNRSATSPELNMIGAYGPWADSLYNNDVGELSFRNSAWNDIESWKTAARQRVSDLIARPDTGGVPEASVIATHNYDGLIIEELSWQLPYGPETLAYFVKPQGEGPFPGIIAMHDHRGNKYFGRRKITRISDTMHPMMENHHNTSYGSRALANELAKLGFAVLVPDVFTFASRRMFVGDTTNRPEVRRNGTDVSAAESNSEINRYNTWAAQHESIVAKSLFSAGTTWPGIFLSEDQRALDVLAARTEVDASNLGCIGLSGGGLRTVLLTGMDSRIKAGVCVGMMSTWTDYLMHHSFMHTWMAFIPHLPRYMDYSEIFSLNMSACLVLNNTSDQIFDLEEMQRAGQILQEVYDKAGEPDKFKVEFYPGNHKFDANMQDDAYDWLLKWLSEDGKSAGPSQNNGELKLGENFPNPFSDSTKIPLHVPEFMYIELSIYNSFGSHVSTLINQEMEAGYHEIQFKGTDLASGVYICRLKTNRGITTNNMLLIK